MTASQAQPSSLQEVAGTIVLIGAGKMGAAMLDGWIALGLEPSRVAVIEPQPSPEISALAARGVKLNPAPAAVPDPAVIVIAVKPQVAAEVVPDAAPLVGRSTVIVSIMAGARGPPPRPGASPRPRDRPHQAQPAGGARPRHHGRGRERARVAAAARSRAPPAGGDRRGRMGGR